MLPLRVESYASPPTRLGFVDKATTDQVAFPKLGYTRAIEMATDALLRKIKVFISSPGDLAAERRRIGPVIARLNGEYAGFVRIESIMYEEHVYSSREGGFQVQIEKSSQSDIVLAMFWGRLGTPLPDTFPEKFNGEPFASGTVYELTTAWDEQRRTGKGPEVYVFRKTSKREMPDDPCQLREAVDQWERLNNFFTGYFESPQQGIRRAHERFDRAEELEAKVEKLLRRWILDNVSRGVTWPIETKGSPFRGLEPFDARHSGVYFGRERKVFRALEELKMAARRGSPFLLIPGASGAGKSSLMRAGIAPRLVQPGTVEDVDAWRTAVMRPGAAATPKLALCRALFVSGSESDDPGGFGPALPELSADAMRSPEILSKLLDESVEFAVDAIVAAIDKAAKQTALAQGIERPLRAKLLLLIDQFEEAFSDGGSDAERVRQSEERQRFFEIVLRLLATDRVWVIATLRGDLYERMITERPLIALKDHGGQYDLCPPGSDELEEIVLRSMEAAGLSFEERCEPDERGILKKQRLVDVILRDAAGENTLPLLQFALDQLFQRCWVTDKSKVFTMEAYQAIGGIDGSIEKSAEAALAKLVVFRNADTTGTGSDANTGGRDGVAQSAQDTATEIERHINPILESLLRQLVGPVSRDWDDGGEGSERALTVRSVPIGAICTKNSLTMPVVDALLTARVFTVNGLGDQRVLRIAHDRVLVSWRRAQTLISRNRNFYRVFDAVEHARRVWATNGKSNGYLLPEGAQVAEGEVLLREHGDELSAEMRDYLRRSIARARRHQRLAWATAGVFGILALTAAVVAGYAVDKRAEAIKATHTAQRQEQRATNNYVAARDTVGQLVTSISEKLRDADGIPVETIEDALKAISSLVGKLSSQSGGDSEFERILGDLHFEFAKVFQNKKQSSDNSAAGFSATLVRALAEAKTALQLRERLAAEPGAPAARRLEYAASLDRLGDVHREMAKDMSKSRLPDAERHFSDSLTAFQRSFDIRRQLLDDDPNDAKRRFAMSQSLVRVGDCKDFPEKNSAEALILYEQALALALQSVAEDPDDIDWRREFAMTVQKVARMKALNDPRQGMLLQDLEVDARLFVHLDNPTNTLWKRDLAYSLTRRCDACVKAKQFKSAADAIFDAIVLREELVATDRLQRLWSNELSDAYRKAGDVMARLQDSRVAVGLFALAVEERSGNGAHERATTAEIAKQRAELLDALRASDSDVGIEETCLAAATDALRDARERFRSADGIGQRRADDKWADFAQRLRAIKDADRLRFVYSYVEQRATSLVVAPKPLERPRQEAQRADGNDVAPNLEIDPVERLWTRADGKTLRATCIGFQDGKVTLKNSMGRTTTVLLVSLCDEDQQFVQRMPRR